MIHLFACLLQGTVPYEWEMKAGEVRAHIHNWYSVFNAFTAYT